MAAGALETVDVQTYTAAGPFTVNLEAVRQKANAPVPGRPGSVWGCQRIRFECDLTIAALSTQAGATPGKRVQEFADRIEILVNGQARPCCYAGGRAMTELRRCQEGKVVFPDVTDLADADATLTRRVVFEFSWRDPRFEDANEHIVHAAALGAGHVYLTWLFSALVTGVTLTSVVCTTKVQYEPIDRGHNPIPLELREEALGNGVVSALRNPLPDPDAAINLWLMFKGIRTSAGGRPQFDESVRMTMIGGGKTIIDDQTIQSLTELFDATQVFDAAAEESTTAPEVLHLLTPGQEGILLSETPELSRGGQVRNTASMDDSGNTSTGLFVVSYGARGSAPGSQESARYIAAIQPAHFPGQVEFTEVPKAANGKSIVPAKVAHLVPRIVMPTSRSMGR